MVGAEYGFRFVHVLCPGTMDPWSVCPTPLCVTTTNSAILNSISTAQTITVASQVTNAKGSNVFGSWYVDVTCAGGQHAYISSDGVSTKMFSTTGSGDAGTSDDYTPNCTPSTAPPVSGGNWYDLNASLSGWGDAAVVNPALADAASQIWSKQITNPATGRFVPVVSYNTSAGRARTASCPVTSCISARRSP
jgi:hypothetical protein